MKVKAWIDDMRLEEMNPGLRRTDGRDFRANVHFIVGLLMAEEVNELRQIMNGSKFVSLEIEVADEYGESKVMKYLKEHLGKAMFEDALKRVAKLIEGGEELMEVDATGFLNKVADALERWDKIVEDQRTELMEIGKALGMMGGGVGRSMTEEIHRLHAQIEREAPAHVVEPGKVPHSREPEPYATLRFGDVEIRLGLTYMYHLCRCNGWGNKESSYFDEDHKMELAVEMICKLLDQASKDVPFYPCDMGCGLNEGIHPRPIEQNERGEVTKVAWVCTACDKIAKNPLTVVRSGKKKSGKS